MVNTAHQPGSFQTDGFSVIRGLLAEPELQEIEKAIANVAQQDKVTFEEGHFFLAAGTTDVVQQIEHLQRYSAIFKNLAGKRQILDSVEAIFDDQAVCDNVSYMAKPARVGAVVPWHQDNAYYYFTPDDALSVWVALDASNVENGCLRVIPGSHRRGLVEHGPTGVRGISYGVAEKIDPERDGEVAIELDRGDASLHHCALFHSSHPNNSARSRRGLVMFFHARRCRVDAKGMEHYRQARSAMIDDAKR